MIGLRTTGGFGPIFRREIKAYLASPLFYVLVGILLLVTSVMFLYLLYRFSYLCTQPKLQLPEGFERNATREIIMNTFYTIHFFLLSMIPILSMRLIAEEKRSGTLELLVTNPVRDWALVLGKYFGALSVIGLLLVLLLALPLVVALLGGQPEWPVVASCFIGLLFVSGAYLSFGLFASSITESQVIAAVVSYIGLFLFYVAGGLVTNVDNEKVRALARGAAIEQHFQGFTAGNVQLTGVVYFTVFSLFFLFLSTQMLGMRKWRI